MTLNGVMAVRPTLRYFTEFGKSVLQKTICGARPPGIPVREFPGILGNRETQNSLREFPGISKIQAGITGNL